MVKNNDKIHKCKLNNSLKSYRSGWWFQCILLLLAVTMVICSFSPTSFANEIEEAKKEKTNLEKKKDETELRLKELEKVKEDILKYIEKLDMELNKLTEEIDVLNEKIEEANYDLKIAEEDLKLAKATEENQYSIMKKRIQYMYENGNSSYLEVILQSESLSDVMNHVEYMSKITEYDNSLLDRYKELKREVINRENILKEKLTTFNELKAELIYEQETVERLVTDKNNELVKYEDHIEETEELSSEYSSKLIEQEELIEDLLEAERIRIEQERKAEEERRRKEEEERRRKEEEEERRRREQEEAASNNGSTKYDGDFIWPVPSSGRITSDFGYRSQPTKGASTYHRGLDIGAPSGSKIVAAAGGEVVTASYNVSSGNYIMIAHGNSTYTVYMHCSKLLVSVGDQVSQGDVIALVGSTGVSTGPHLHFGVSINGSYVDPEKYVSY